jgi:hypothetical protein
LLLISVSQTNCHTAARTDMNQPECRDRPELSSPLPDLAGYPKLDCVYRLNMVPDKLWQDFDVAGDRCSSERRTGNNLVDNSGNTFVRSHVLGDITHLKGEVSMESDSQ